MLFQGQADSHDALGPHLHGSLTPLCLKSVYCPHFQSIANFIIMAGVPPPSLFCLLC